MSVCVSVSCNVGVLLANGWMDLDVTVVGLVPGHIVTLHVDPASHPPKGGGQPHNFWPMSVVVKRLGGSRCYLVRRYALAQTTLC